MSYTDDPYETFISKNPFDDNLAFILKNIFNAALSYFKLNHIVCLYSYINSPWIPLPSLNDLWNLKGQTRVARGSPETSKY